jgi:transposase
MVLSNYCKQRIIELYLVRKLLYGSIVATLEAEGLKLSKKAAWATIKKYKAHGTISRLLGSGRPYKLSEDILKTIEARMKEDDETMATQILKLLEDKGYDKVSRWMIIRARKLLGWTYMCLLIAVIR